MFARLNLVKIPNLMVPKYVANSYRNCKCGFAAASVLLAVVLSTTCVLADLQRDSVTVANSLSQPIQVKLTLSSPTTIVAGEPILVHYEIVNTTPRDLIRTDLGTYGTRWYSINLENGDGSPVAVIPDRRQIHPRGAVAVPNGLLQPGKRLQGDIVVSRFRAIQRAGTYNLTVKVKLAYAQSQTGEALLWETMTSSPSYLKTEFSFPLTVSEPNLPILRRKAQTLQQLFLAEPDSKKRKVIAEQLFFMPEQAAFDVWRRLALDTSSESDRILVAQALSQTNSLQAADLLVRMMLNEPDKTSQVNNAILIALGSMSEQGDEAIKRHIEEMRKRYHLILLTVID